jgi:hypothetical protein
MKHTFLVNHRLLLEKIDREPVYLFSEFEEIAMRTELVGGEPEIYVKHKDTHEFKAVYDSRIVGIALAGNPVIISREEYDNF